MGLLYSKLYKEASTSDELVLSSTHNMGVSTVISCCFLQALTWADKDFFVGAENTLQYSHVNPVFS